MPKFRKINNRRPSIVRADVSYYSKGIRRQIRIAYPADAEKQLAEPGDWKTLYQGPYYKLRVCHAKQETNWNMQGEAMFYLFFKDGRKVKVNIDEFSRRESERMNGAIRAYLYPEKSFRRVQGWYRKRARSKERMR